MINFRLLLAITFFFNASVFFPKDHVSSYWNSDVEEVFKDIIKLPDGPLLDFGKSLPDTTPLDVLRGRTSTLKEKMDKLYSKIEADISSSKKFVEKIITSDKNSEASKSPVNEVTKKDPAASIDLNTSLNSMPGGMSSPETLKSDMLDLSKPLTNVTQINLIDQPKSVDLPKPINAVIPLGTSELPKPLELSKPLDLSKSASLPELSKPLAEPRPADLLDFSKPLDQSKPAPLPDLSKPLAELKPADLSGLSKPLDISRPASQLELPKPVDLSKPLELPKLAV
jgi:hypothetical protein